MEKYISPNLSKTLFNIRDDIHFIDLQQTIFLFRRALRFLNSIESNNYKLLFLENILGVIQDFDPTGVGARNLSECLLLQLREIEISDELKKCCTAIISYHLEELASNDYSAIRKSLGAPELLIQEALLIIKSLNPKPGSIISPRGNDYVYPDVLARKVANNWIVELNSEVLPKIKIKLYPSCLLYTSPSPRDQRG